jgi:protein-disulfide isomerase
VNANDLKKCLDGGKYDQRLLDDQDLSATLGVSGTPGFFVNATNFAGAYSWKDMQSVVDSALK